ncbi:uncharacterized protein LOC131010238 isoform X2 [Salvia miltiorrhiza]|uniref:uncharacterized protein LOC131010238 isoform X2 n=1 Tax=Salvia miltiorrhiza TaxID=226208 RepID=UPI0025AD534D|nr:uncharacterized protein LOC131010238 isoform X2 [Salvia miltiorrhiza]
MGCLCRFERAPLRVLVIHRRFRRTSFLPLSINFTNQSAMLNVALGSPVTRWASVAFGVGVGIGSAYSECAKKFNTSAPKLTPLPEAGDE